jgi:adenylate cyclase
MDARSNADGQRWPVVWSPGMDRLWQWAWDRYGARYSWAVYAFAFALALPIHLLWSFLIVAIEESSNYVEAACGPR